MQKIYSKQIIKLDVLNLRICKIVLCISLISLASCSTNYNKWNKTDKKLMKYMVAGQVTDYGLTQYGMHNGYIESNPIARNMNTIEMGLFKITGSYFLFWLADKFPENRKTILIVGNITGWDASAWNVYKLMEN